MSKLLSNADLSNISNEELGLYASRCALRVLPYALNNEFDYLDRVVTNPKHYIAGLNLSALGYFSALESSELVKKAAEAVINPDDNITKSFSMASAVAAYHAAAAAVEATIASTADHNETIQLAAINAEKYALSAIYLDTVISGPDVMRVEEKDYSPEDVRSLAFQAERNSVFEEEIAALLDGKSLKGVQLWRTYPANIPLRTEVQRWLAFLENNGMYDYSVNYQKILEGEKSPKVIYEKLYKKWKLDKAEIEPPRNDGLERLNLHGDLSINPEKPSRQDSLGRERLVDSIAELLSHPDHVEPLTIGLLGDWGAGKTTVLNLLEQVLEKGGKSSVNYTVKVFNAWSYEHTENIQAGIAQSAIIGLSESKKTWRDKAKLAWKLQGALNTFKRNIYTGLLALWLGAILFLACYGRLDTVLGIGLSTSLMLFFLYTSLKTIYSHNISKEFVTFFQLPDFTSDVGKLPVYQLQVEEMSKLCLTGSQRMLFVVDDLDRCSAEGIVKVFEAIRLVMELNNVTVIIAIDHRIAMSALAHHYDAFEEKGSDRSRFDVARDYLGKIIQLPINLDRPSEEMVNKYVESLFDGNLVSQEKNYEGEGVAERSPVEGSTSFVKEEAHVFKENETQTEVDSGVVMPEEIKNDTMLHSPAEKQRFIELTHLFGFHNPRQLKRLHSSYRLLRAYSKVSEDESLKYLCGLFFLEYCHSQEARQDQVCESHFLNFLDEERIDQNVMFSYLSECFTSKEEYLSIKRVVKPFVLPQVK